MQRTAKNSAVRSAKKSAKGGLTNPLAAYIIANIKGKGVLESHSPTPFLFTAGRRPGGNSRRCPAFLFSRKGVDHHEQRIRVFRQPGL